MKILSVCSQCEMCLNQYLDHYRPTVALQSSRWLNIIVQSLARWTARKHVLDKLCEISLIRIFICLITHICYTNIWTSHEFRQTENIKIPLIPNPISNRFTTYRNWDIFKITSTDISQSPVKANKESIHLVARRWNERDLLERRDQDCSRLCSHETSM